jgi:hypothetical protein
MTLNVVSLSIVVAAVSTIHDWGQPLKSEETSSSSLTVMTWLRTPSDDLSLPAEASRSGKRKSSFEATGVERVTVRSTRETLLVGTRTEMPVSLPASSGRTREMAEAAPVVVGMMLEATERPRLRWGSMSSMLEEKKRRNRRTETQTLLAVTVENVLRGGGGVDGSHHTALNTKSFVEDFGERRKAVCLLRTKVSGRRKDREGERWA